MSMARPTSLIAAFAAMVPKVIICATFSRPYLCVTYSITSPRRFMQKSISISGIEMRSGFRKRSNSSSCCSGSISVMPSEYATTAPAADPRPGPTGMPLFPRVTDEIPHDQKISRELHLLNNGDLARQSLFVFDQRMLKPPGSPPRPASSPSAGQIPPA